MVPSAVESTVHGGRRKKNGWGRLAIWAVAAMVIALMVGELFVRTTEGLPGYRAAFGTPEGVTEADVIAGAGQPSRLIQPATGHCAERGGVRELVYELSSRGFGGWGQKIVDAQIVVCIAGDGRVVETLHVEF